ncbi:iron-sulfur cluster repair di-iron protein [Paenibacillus turpanensis]|uniref:iron-sulfur cluster repair di-iron protein n=1 Tax=Paenibacillus turpanensis TaxID=2689078 RepID=UPI00140760F1|nr:iron-sulfur cluster repair di-iron protein [Paenibacillus turpanensis]
MGAYSGAETVGAIVADFPGASNIFKEFQIDFCCGGHKPLEEAIALKGLKREVVIQRLNDAKQQSDARAAATVDWRVVTMGELVDHISTKHHAFLVKELPVLSEFVTKVMRVHGEHQPDVLKPLHRLYHQLKLEIELHLAEEEQVLFPLVKQAEGTNDRAALQKAVHAIGGLVHDHNGVGELLKQIRETTNQFELPAGACTTYRITFQKLQELEADMFDHIHLENNILFPRIEAYLNENGGDCACKPQ